MPGLSATTVTHNVVAEYYGKVLSSSKDLRTSACSAASRPSARMRDFIANVPEPVKERFYGCGNPLPDGGLEGFSILDLGSGSGRDCYVASQLVGPSGRVTGVDLSPEQTALAQKHASDFCVKQLNYPRCNMEFHQGYIEQLDDIIPPNSVDLVISNCVINLSPDKAAVLRGIHRALKPGGEAFFSDVYCHRRLPARVREHKVLWGECLAGALYIEDFRRLCHATGFADPRVVERAPIVVTDESLASVLGNAKFESVSYRLFKLDGLESTCEDYGQAATYLGSIPGREHSYVLDHHHVFETGKPMLVCGNTATILGESWLAGHFRVAGDRSVHFGLFQCGTPTVVAAAATESSAAPSTCC